MKEIRTEDAVGHILCHDITQIIKDVKKGVLFKKGHIVREEDIPLLLSVGKEHLYVWEKKEGILHENEGAEILYKICAGDSDTMHGSDIKEGKIELIADIDGVLKIRREALLAVKKAVNSAESKEDAINQMETIYSQAYDLLTRSGMSAEDAASKLEPLRSAIDSLKKFLKDSFISLDTIQAAVSVIVDAALASDTTEKGLYDLVRTVLDGKDTDPAVKRVILVVARDVLDKADWTQLTPSLLNDVVDLAVDKVKDKYGKYPFVNELMDELKDPLNELVHREVGWDTINKVREVFFNAIDNAVAGIDAGKDNEALLAQARADLLKLSPVVSEEMQRIGAKAADLISDHLKDKITNALPGIQLPEFIGSFVGGLAQDVVNEKLDEYDPKLTATIDQYVLYLTCPGHDYHYITTRATTCTEDGEEKLKCSKCGWVRSDNKITHKKLGHVPVVDEAADPTETEEGQPLRPLRCRAGSTGGHSCPAAPDGCKAGVQRHPGGNGYGNAVREPQKAGCRHGCGPDQGRLYRRRQPAVPCTGEQLHRHPAQ